MIKPARSSKRPWPRKSGSETAALFGTGPIYPRSFSTRSMGGRLVVHIALEDRRRKVPEVVLSRINRWADRLTRHSEYSDLARLNADPGQSVVVRPTLARALRAGTLAAQETGGLVNITLLDARLAAEKGQSVSSLNGHTYSITDTRRGGAIIERAPGVHFDLGGVGKGLLSDRALGLLERHTSAIVDADGDMAIRVAAGRSWQIAVADPRNLAIDLCVLAISDPSATGSVQFGVATSGNSVHRWEHNGLVSHHLIDPRTGLSARSDVVQATVIARSASRAEALAKAVVIAGSYAGLNLLEKAGALGAIILTSSGRILAPLNTDRYLIADRRAKA